MQTPCSLRYNIKIIIDVLNFQNSCFVYLFINFITYTQNVAVCRDTARQSSTPPWDWSLARHGENMSLHCYVTVTGCPFNNVSTTSVWWFIVALYGLEAPHISLPGRPHHAVSSRQYQSRTQVGGVKDRLSTTHSFLTGKSCIRSRCSEYMEQTSVTLLCWLFQHQRYDIMNYKKYFRLWPI